MTNPFASTVGLKGVSPDSPAPIVVINDIPGITAELVTNLKTADTAAALDVWTKVQRLGFDKLVSMVEGELSKSADFAYTRTRTGPLMAPPPGTVTVASPMYVGYFIQADVAGSDELYIKSLTLDSFNEEPVATHVKVFSGLGKELFSRAVTVTPDDNEVPIGYSTRSKFGRSLLLFVGIDATGLGLRTLGMGQCWEDGSGDIEAATITTAGPFAVANLLAQTTTAVMLDAVIRRSVSDVVARYADRLQWAYAYVCASLLMTEKLASPNFNLYTNTNRLFTEEQLPALLEEAKTRMRPVCRDMLKELSRAEVVTKAAGPYDSGYTVGSFVD